MVLAQDAPVICLDEPINHLDVAHQLDCLDLVKSLNREHGKTVLVVLHDLNLAGRFADRLVVMKDGQIAAQGAPRDLVTPELMRDVFGVEAVILTDPVHDSPLCIARRSVPAEGAA
jgi:iron complex transport system ATP-binding protein